MTDDSDPMPTGDLDAIDTDATGDLTDLGGYVPSILRLAPACPECDCPEMEAGHAYHPTLYEQVPAWHCPECGYEEVREDDVAE